MQHRLHQTAGLLSRDRRSFPTPANGRPGELRGGGSIVRAHRHGRLHPLRARRRRTADRQGDARGAARRAVARRPRARRRRPLQDQPRRRVRRGADLRRRRRPARGGGRLHVRARRRDGAAAHREGHGLAGPRPVPARRPPRRRQRRRRDGRRHGLRHAQRRLRGAAPLPPGGRDLRPRRAVREPQPQGPRLHALEHRHPRRARDRRVQAGPRPGRPARRRDEHGMGPVLRLDPVLLPPGLPRRGDGRVVRRQRLPRDVRLHGGRRVRHRLRRRPVHGVRVRRPRHAGDPRGLHRPHRPRGAAAAVGARLPPVPLVPLHAGRRRGPRRPPPRGGRPVRRAVAGHRLHGRLPRLHLGRGGVPGPARHARAAARAGLPRDHDHRPRRQARPRLRDLRPGRGARRAVPDGERRPLRRPGLARPHRVPRLRHRGGRAAGGASSTPRTSSPGSPASGTT